MPALGTLKTNHDGFVSLYDTPFLVNYELDLWGKYRSVYQSSLRNVEAQEQAYRSALLTLTTDLASSYFNVRTLDMTSDFLAATLENRRKNLELSQSRFDKGLIGYIDVTNDQVALTNAEADYDESIRLRNLQENRIAALIGIPASVFHLEHMPLEDQPPAIPAGIPSTVLLRRPDVIQAERQMASEHALIGAAYASFSSLSLTGALGFLSLDVQQLFRYMTRYWEVGASGNQTIFDGWRKYENYEASWARFRRRIISINSRFSQHSGKWKMP